MDEGFRIWANPSSPHAEGRKAKAALEDARERIKAALGWDGELIFTSGASEALWIALNRAKAKRRIVSAVEHDAVFRAAPDAEVAPIVPNRLAQWIDVNWLDDMLQKDGKALCAIQSINSETGSYMWSEANSLSEVVRSHDALVLTDCSQSAGKFGIELNPDFAVVSAHKFGGPIGVGALLVRDFNLLEPIGGHERGYRQGTENLPAILGMAAALECGGTENWKTTDAQQYQFRQSLYDSIGDYADSIELATAHPFLSCPWITAIAHPTMSAQALLIRLDAMGFAVSAGSACSSGTLKKSRVLDAFGVPDDVAERTIRVSLGWSTTPDELERFAEAWRSLT
ncbi:cysteine desulfurase family protein [Erythrobacter sp. GH1-10]|uniref:cysteine desulfurase family protein n=1 Tax=Erythrobacter sp. GH1-10 TaxID=3349334 RepID=UPI0038779287